VFSFFYDKPKIYGLGKNLFGGRKDDCQKKEVASYISVRFRLHPQHRVLCAGVAISWTAISWRDVIPPPLLLSLSKAKLTDWLAEWLTSDWLTGWLAGLLTDWLADWLNGWLTAWLADWLTGWLAGWLTDWLTDWLAGWLSGWLAGWLTGWMTDWLADWLNDWLADWLADWLTNNSFPGYLAAPPGHRLFLWHPERMMATELIQSLYQLSFAVCYLMSCSRIRHVQ
jgi:uncharacterized membrane protein YeaQ/YmgE (transglycosylase-associated protein family)